MKYSSNHVLLVIAVALLACLFPVSAFASPELGFVAGNTLLEAQADDSDEGVVEEDMICYCGNISSISYTYDVDDPVSIEFDQTSFIGPSCGDSSAYDFTTDQYCYEFIPILPGEFTANLVDSKGVVVKIIHLTVKIAEPVERYICMGSYVWEDATSYDTVPELYSEDDLENKSEIRLRDENVDYMTWLDGVYQLPMCRRLYSVKGLAKGDYTVTVTGGGAPELYRINYHVVDHEYGDWVVTKNPTCLEVGSKEKTCSRCDDKVVEEIPALEHTWANQYTVDLEPTCTSEGSESIYCTVCGAVKEGSTQPIPKKEHQYSEWTTVIEPTFEQEGTKQRECLECGEIETAAIPMLEGIDISSCAVSGIVGKTYNGEPQEQIIELSYEGETLELGRDYDILYRDNINAGKATAVITGKGDYAGSKSIEFEISPAELSGIEIEQSSYIYDGEQKSPQIIVRGIDGEALDEGNDYVLEVPAGRVEQGEYTYTAIGKGNYTGSLNVVMTIESFLRSSRITEDNLILTRDTDLILDSDLSLDSISGQYSLNIFDEGNHALTVTA